MRRFWQVEIDGKVVAITGASSGIGEATALLLAERGARLVLGARNPERLSALAARLSAAGCDRAVTAGRVWWTPNALSRRSFMCRAIVLTASAMR